MCKTLTVMISIILMIVSIASASFAQADKDLKIISGKPVSKEQPKKLEVKLTRQVAIAFFNFYGREPNPAEAEYWNNFSKNKIYKQDELVEKIQEKFLFPNTDKKIEMDLKEAQEIVLRVYQNLKKPAPEQKDIDYWLNRMLMATAYYRVMIKQMSNK